MHTSISEGLFQRSCSGCAVRNRCGRIRSMARPSSEPPAMKDLGPAINSPTSSSLPPRSSVVSTTSPTPPVPPRIYPLSYRVSLFDAMKFNGPAPEIINARLAMLGFLYAASNEAQTGRLIHQQLQESPVFPVLLSGLFIWASLVPILKGAKRESFGYFTPTAELTNGRTAMLAFAVLLLLEYKSGVPLF